MSDETKTPVPGDGYWSERRTTAGPNAPKPLKTAGRLRPPPDPEQWETRDCKFCGAKGSITPDRLTCNACERLDETITEKLVEATRAAQARQEAEAKEAETVMGEAKPETEGEAMPAAALIKLLKKIDEWEVAHFFINSLVLRSQGGLLRTQYSLLLGAAITARWPEEGREEIMEAIEEVFAEAGRTPPQGQERPSPQPQCQKESAPASRAEEILRQAAAKAKEVAKRNEVRGEDVR